MERPTSARSHDNGTDSWSVVTTQSGVRAVDRYSWWSERTASFTARRELASTGGVFIVNLGEPIEIVDATGEVHRIGAGAGFVGGPATRTSWSRSAGGQTGLHVHLPPLVLARLLGIPLAALRDRVATLDAVIGRDAVALGDRLLAAPTHEARWHVLDHFLGGRGDGDDDREIAHAWQALAAGTRVQAVADDLGWTRKRLAQRLRDATGLLPRGLAGLARFERFAAIVQAEPCLSLAAAAHDAGYADQAHLTREVSRYAGLSPAALRARVIPGGGGVRD